MRLDPGRIAIAALLLASCGNLGHGADASAEGPAYTVEIEPGITPRLQPSEVVELLRPEYQTKVLSVKCIKSTSFHTWGEPEGAKIIWVVRIDVPFFRPHANAPPTSSRTQTHVFDDATGNGLGRGTGF
ncbi:MAG: hypothetical protein ACHQ3O_14735 [Candidatus Limnocylindria bacterium]